MQENSCRCKFSTTGIITIYIAYFAIFLGGLFNLLDKNFQKRGVDMIIASGFVISFVTFYEKPDDLCWNGRIIID